MKVSIIEAKRRAGDLSSIYADPSFAQRHLSRSATIDIDNIVRSSYQRYVANPNGFPAN